MNQFIKTLLNLAAGMFVIYCCSVNANNEFEELQKSAKKGQADAQTKLGVMYEKGVGVTKNYKKAIEWYKKAAEQEFAEAQYNLGVIYQEGRQGIIKDYTKAINWYKKAVAQGLANAKQNLNILLRKDSPDSPA
jgi:TPR repeat protein